MLIYEFFLEMIVKLEFLYVELIILVIYYIKYVINLIILLVMSNDFWLGCLSVCVVDDFYLVFIWGNCYLISCCGNMRVRRL